MTFASMDDYGRVDELRNSLVGHLAMWTQRPGNSTTARDQLNPFLTKLCVAIAALSVQASGSGSCRQFGW